MTWLVKVDAFDGDGNSHDFDFTTDQDLEELFHDLLNPNENIEYSRIQIINVGK